MIRRGRIPSLRRFITASPLWRANTPKRVSTAGTDAEPGSDIPMASPTEAMVLAVNIPAQEPAPGQALRSISSRSSALIRPWDSAPIPSKTSTMEMSRPR